MDSAAGLLTAAGGFVSVVVGAVVLIMRELRRNPRKSDRIVTLINLLARVRDWLQGAGLWDDIPEGLRSDVKRELASSGDQAEEDDDDRST